MSDDLSKRLRGAYSTVFDRSLAREAADMIDTLLADLDAARANSYPHMCRMDHVQIGHRDSEGDEQCPLCVALYDNAALRAECKAVRSKLREGVMQARATREALAQRTRAERDRLAADLARAEGLLRHWLLVPVDTARCPVYWNTTDYFRHHEADLARGCQVPSSGHMDAFERAAAMSREAARPFDHVFNKRQLHAVTEREGRCSYCGGEPCCYPSEGKPECLRDARLRSERARGATRGPCDEI